MPRFFALDNTFWPMRSSDVEGVRINSSLHSLRCIAKLRECERLAAVFNLFQRPRSFGAWCETGGGESPSEPRSEGGLATCETARPITDGDSATDDAGVRSGAFEHRGIEEIGDGSPTLDEPS